MAITVTPTVDLVNVPARVRLDVSASAGETSTTVTRLNPDGTTTTVRTTDGNPLPLSAGTGLVYDYEMFYGQPVSYSSLETPGTVSASVQVDQSQVWLVHPGVPALSQPLDLLPGSLLEEAYTTKQGVFYAQGRTNPLVVTDGARKGASSQLVILTSTLPQIDQLRALVSGAGVLLLNIPAQLNVGFQSCYVAAQDMKIARLTDVVIDAYRSITLPFVVVDRPVGGSMAQRTYADLLNYSTYAALQAAYASYTALLAGP
jgi:hypothetical protein